MFSTDLCFQQHFSNKTHFHGHFEKTIFNFLKLDIFKMSKKKN